MIEKFQLSDFQKRALLIPETFDIFFGGGRGGGKSYAILTIILRLVELYKQNARILYIRREYKGLCDFEDKAREVFTAVYGKSARYNQTEHIWRLPHGAYLELGELKTAQEYDKFQGRSFILIIVDEASQYPTSYLLDLLRSNLRGPNGVPLRVIYAANPGGVGHHWLAKRFVFKAGPWEPFQDEHTGRTVVYAPSTYRDNPFIDQEAYRAQLQAACPSDPELLRAWEEGDWAVARGAYFAGVLDEKRSQVDPWPCLPGKIPPKDEFDPIYSRPPQWQHWLAMDYGSSAPAVVYLMAKSPGAEGPDGRFYPRNSIVMVDELASSLPDNPSVGLGWTVNRLAEEIKELCGRWGIRPDGVADDACFAKHGHQTGSIADEFKAEGVYLQPAKKGSRQYGWEVMRRMLKDAGKPDKPGLYISRNCSYFWQTVPFLDRDPRNVEDVDSRGPDHGADACRYGLLRENHILRFIKVYGI